MNRVLVVEDDDNSRAAIETYLSTLGYEVLSAAHGQEALRLGRVHRPEILICDWILQDDIDGVDVARELFRDSPRVLIMFLTGLPVERLRAHTRELPVSRFLAKPVGLHELARALDEVLAAIGERPPERARNA